MAKKKYYVVWEGKEKGIFDSWEECKQQVDNYQGAKYKSFPSKLLAEQAFKQGHVDYKKSSGKVDYTKIPEIVMESLSVDAACSGNPGKMEYRGVHTGSGKELFRKGPFEEGTNNIGEFLAIVHGLALLKKQNKEATVYTDSRTALAWIRKKKCNTKLPVSDKNKELFNLIARAEKWLRENTWSSKLVKWETENWGEIPADFGRK